MTTTIDNTDTPLRPSPPTIPTALKDFLAHALGKDTDAFLHRLALIAVQTRKTQDMLSLQAQLLGEQARIVQQWDALRQAKTQLANDKRALTLEKKRQAQEPLMASVRKRMGKSR